MTTPEHKSVLLAIYQHELSITEKFIADELNSSDSISFVSRGITATYLEPLLVEARKHWRFRHITEKPEILNLFGAFDFFGWWSSPFFHRGKLSMKVLGSIAWFLSITPPLFLAIFTTHYCLNSLDKYGKPLSGFELAVVFIITFAASFIALSGILMLARNLLLSKLRIFDSRASFPLHIGFYLLVVYFLCPYHGSFKKKLIESAKQFISVRDQKEGDSFEDRLNGIHCTNSNPKSIIGGLSSYSHIKAREQFSSKINFSLTNPNHKDWPYTEEPTTEKYESICESLGHKFISSKENMRLKATHIPSKDVAAAIIPKNTAL